MKRGPEPFQVHPNSIWGTATPATRAAIKARRKRYYEDLDALKVWFQAGCGPSMQSEYINWDADA